MLEKLFLHLVQYADELKNSSRPSIECGVFDSLQNVHISHTNEPSLTMEYRTPTPIDFSASSPNSLSSLSRAHQSSHTGLDPIECLRYSSQFCHEASSYDGSLSPPTNSVSLSSGHLEVESSGSVGDWSIPESSEESHLFSISSRSQSGISWEGSTSEDQRQQKEKFDPFGDALLDGLLALNTQPFDESKLERSDGAEQREQRVEPLVEEQTGKLTSVIPCMTIESLPAPTNVFVANFPSHWSKSDLWDLFEGIPVTTVHVLPEKRGGGEEATIGGTGFVNVTRAGDAQALLSMLDKKIWLIDGSALKFRLANSSAPAEPMTFHVPKKNRTIRRHQHKVIDRLRAEQTVGNKQVGACDRHQIVVYKNKASVRPGGVTLSVVHGSRQRNGYFACSASESGARPIVPQRPLLDFLRAQLNRWNNYNNSQQIVSGSVKYPVPSLNSVKLNPSPRVVLAPTQLPRMTGLIGDPSVPSMANAQFVPSIQYFPMHVPSPIVQPRMQFLEISNATDGSRSSIAYVPPGAYISLPPGYPVTVGWVWAAEPPTRYV